MPAFLAGSIEAVMLAIMSAMPLAGMGAAGSAPTAQASPLQPVDSALSRAPLIYVVRYRPGPHYRPDRSLLQQDLREHGAYMRRQTEAGVIIAAGPTFDQAGGLVLISAGSLTDAEAFASEDPAVRTGIFMSQITDWRPLFDAKSLFRGTLGGVAGQ